MLKKNRGYTLTELMIVVGVIGFIGSLTSVFYYQLYRSYSLTDAKTRVTQVAINSLSSVQKQLRAVSQKPVFAPNATVHPTPTGTVAFYIPSLVDPTARTSDDLVEYYNGDYNGRNILLQRLTRGTIIYPPIPVIFDLENYRANPGTVPQAGGVVEFLKDPTLRFDDVAFFYDETYNMINVGIIVSTEDKGRKGRRESLTMTSAIAVRNTY